MVQDIQEGGVYRVMVTGAEVAQEMCDLIERLGDVLALFGVSQTKALAGMRMVETERSYLAGEDRFWHSEARSGGEGAGDEASSAQRRPGFKLFAHMAHDDLENRYDPRKDPTLKHHFARAGSLAAVTCFTCLLAGPGMTADTAGPTLSAQAEALRARVEVLAVEPRVAEVPVADHWFLTRYYERRQFTPVWDTPAKLAQLIDALAGSERHGLDPDDYHLNLLRERLAELANGVAFRPDIEILATDALARMAFHLHFGKVNPEQLEPTWNFTRSMAGISPVNAMARLVNAHDLPSALDALAPQLPRYAALLDALAAHRAIAARGDWPTVPAGPTLRPGDRSPRVAVLRERLRASGELEDGHAERVDAQLADADLSDAERADAEPAVAELADENLIADDESAALDEAFFDAALESAVRRFQRRHALSEDAVVGARTLAALNVPVTSRIDQLRVNLERVRWVFRDLGPRYVIANIARFRVSLIEDGEVVWETRAVVGRSYRQTPVFRSEMRYLVFNPTWTVPPGILARDLLPEIRRDPETLTRRNMVLLDLQGRPVDASGMDWQSLPARGFPYMIRQEPGPENALGQVKFMYPNPYHVYMHDTPARNLFGETDRAFSSGCVRLDNPLEFARILLAGSGGWDDAAIARTLADGRPRTVNLPRPLPVLTIYATAVPENGEILFLPDVYSRDGRLLAALNEGFRFAPPAGYQESLLDAL